MKSEFLVAAVLAVGLACPSRDSQEGGKPGGAVPESIPAPPAALLAASTPVIRQGACPFECCHYGRWRFRTAADLRPEPSLSTPPLTRLSPGSAVTADSGLVVIDPVGIVVVVRDHEDPDNGRVFPRGDTLYVLDHVGEGFVNVRWRDTLLAVRWLWDSAGTYGGRELRKAETAWWVHVTTSDGKRGWVLMRGVSADGSDACS